jgi:hypothetical protein
MKKLTTEQLGILGSISGRDKTFYCSPDHTDRRWGVPDLMFIGYRGIFARGKRAGA